MMKLSTLKFLYVCPLLVLFYPFVVTSISQAKNMKNQFPAVIAFGDSVLDTGNNNYIETTVKANFKPYGRDFIGGKATGRFCNGKIPSDFLAEMLGVKEAMPPYLDPHLQIEDLLTGVCFASAGSGYDPITIELASVLSVEDQLNMFKEYIGKLKAAVGEKKTCYILAKSLFIISMGSNDISGTYFLASYRRFEYSVKEYASILVNMSSNFIQELHKLGARKIGAFGLSPVGCVPLQRTVLGGIERKCAKKVNSAAKIYNSKLASSLKALNDSFQDARIVYLENYKELNALIHKPKKFGFKVGDSACCGVANVELGPLCNNFALKICEDASQYVFWDSYHPTQRTYNILATEMLKKDIDKFL
ncbi:GDSL esterase/lipase At3g14820-like [Gastrolobium bilobum]|uniref:GDSL esterase/lipase At3g14820-like n=1 Tax=Gastrolobium bilobum TaxID=150636 RepID=UPI002AB04B18|nr:GDSL esterase/lipase At3g14820-like [Gastrolobium bilobum]